MQKDNHKKISFKYYSDVLEEITTETMWAEIVDESKGIYKLDSIPFYGPLIATDDIFYAEYDSTEDNLLFKELIESSGNSIIQIVILKENYDKEIIRKELLKMGCQSEGLNDNFFVLEVPINIDYSKVKLILYNYENNEIIGYAEPILSAKHLDDIEEN